VAQTFKALEQQGWSERAAIYDAVSWRITNYGITQYGGLRRGACYRAGHFGPDPLAANPPYGSQNSGAERAARMISLFRPGVAFATAHEHIV